MTADHVVAGHTHGLAISAQKITALGEIESPVVTDVEEVLTSPLGSFDLAVLRLKHVDGEWQTFELGNTVKGALGVPVSSYGLPAGPNNKLAEPRLLRGHIQRYYFHSGDDGYQYEAAELGFPAFPGQSGSPVYLDSRTGPPAHAVAVVTSSMVYSQPLDDKGHLTSASWAVGLLLSELEPWLSQLR